MRMIEKMPIRMCSIVTSVPSEYVFIDAEGNDSNFKF